MLRELASGLRQLAFPSVCGSCATVVTGNIAHFCPACVIALTHDPHTICPRCCTSVGGFENIVDGCSHCRDERFHFERAFRLGMYEDRLRDVVLRMKQPAGDVLADCVGALWALQAEARLRDAQAHVIIPIPLHWWRKWQRGYNQSEALATAIARQLRLPCRPHWLRRVRATPHQINLGGAERRLNLRGAFRAGRSARLSGKTVLLIDDVLTTGATASEAAKALKEGGAARVIVAVLAHR